MRQTGGMLRCHRKQCYNADTGGIDNMSEPIVKHQMKVGIGLGSSIGLWIVAAGGYDGMAAVQSESAVSAIRFAYGYNGAIIAAICLVLCIMMNIDKYIKDIQRDLEAKRA